MLADIRYWENDATNKHYAIAHFNVWNAEMLMGVIDAAEEAKSLYYYFFWHRFCRQHLI